MNDLKNTTELTEVLHKCLIQLESDTEIQPALLAHRALQKMDPERTAPYLVTWAANLEMRQLARALLRKEFDPLAPDNKQIEMFEGLQTRYPTRRNDEPTYVRLEELTNDEIDMNLERMSREIAAKQKHYDALMAYKVSRAA